MLILIVSLLVSALVLYFYLKRLPEIENFKVAEKVCVLKILSFSASLPLLILAGSNGGSRFCLVCALIVFWIFFVSGSIKDKLSEVARIHGDYN